MDSFPLLSADDPMADRTFTAEPETNRPSEMIRRKRKRIRVFISYAHDDEKFKEALCEHLEQLVVDKLIELWTDTELKLGDRWSKEIFEAIQKADLAIALISTNFFDSDFIREQELPRLRARDQAGTLRLIPVVLKNDQRWEAEFGALQAPLGGEPIERFDEHERWNEAAEGIRAVCLEMLGPTLTVDNGATEQETRTYDAGLLAVVRKLRGSAWVLIALLLVAAMLFTYRYWVGRRNFNYWLEEVERALDRSDRDEARRILAQPPTGLGTQPDVVTLGMDTVQLYGEKQWDADRFMRRLEALLDRSKRSSHRFEGHILTARGSFRLYAWQLDEAERDYTTALRARKTLVEAWFGLGALHFWRDEYAQALKELEHGLAHAPESAELKAAAGAAYAGAGQRQKATELYEHAIRDNAAYLPAYWELARLYRQMSEPAKAADVLRAAQSYLDDALPLGGSSPPLGYRVNEQTARLLISPDSRNPPPPVILLTSNERKRYYFHLSTALSACLNDDHEWEEESLQDAHALIADHAVEGNSKLYAELLLSDEVTSASQACILEILREVEGA